MRRVIYFHIGAHKTATTSIQRTFWKNRLLLAENDFLYPESDLYHFGHHRLAFAMKKQRDPAKGDTPVLEAELEHLLGVIEESPQTRVFLSSEGLFVSPKGPLEQLYVALSSFELRVIAVVRRQDDYLLSLYNQRARMIGNDFTKPLRTYVKDPRSISAEISYLRWLDRWQDIFGADAVQLLRYEDKDPLSAVMDVVGLPADFIRSRIRSNPSLPNAVVETIRLTKFLGLPETAQRAIRSTAVRLFDGWPVKKLSQEQRDTILAEFSEENEKLFSKFAMKNTYLVNRNASTPHKIGAG